MNKFFCFIGRLLYSFKKLYYFFVRRYVTTQFAKTGQNVYIGNNGTFHFDNIEIGDDVYIGERACFQSSYGKIIIGNHVMFGPGVHIHGGNHKVHDIGCYMKHAPEKKFGDDGIITVEDDVWIGANAIILSNVTIGKGSVIGAGAVVTKDIPPYTIYTGVPSAKLRPRFTADELTEHKRQMEDKL